MRVVQRVDLPIRVPPPLGRQESGACVDAGVGKDHVDAALARRHRVEGLRQRGAVGHIDDGARSLARDATIADLVDGAVQLIAVDVQQGDIGPPAGHDLRIGAAQAIGGAGDDDGFARHVEHPV